MPKRTEKPHLELTLQNIIPHLCTRPQMYVQGSTYQEAVGLLWGYHIAMRCCHPEKETELERFQNWASQTYGCPIAQSYIILIAEKYPDDASRFRRLRFTFNKFVRLEAAKRLHNDVTNEGIDDANKAVDVQPQH